MKTPETQTRLTAVVDSLFRRWPTLVGFSVQEARTASSDRPVGRLDRELVLADLETSPWPELTQELCSEIAAALLDLIDDEPATRELLQGRTFARTLH
jgi:hypothetical protein